MRTRIDLTNLAKKIVTIIALGLALIAIGALSQLEAQEIEIETLCGGRLSITWKPPPQAGGYQFTSTGEFGGNVKCSPSESKCVIDGLKPGKDYDYYLDRVTRDGLVYGDPIRLRGPNTEDCPKYVDVTPTPRPPADTCAHLAADILVRGFQPFSTQCQRVSADSVGNAALIAHGILDAVDVWGIVSGEMQVCFRMQGRLKFLDAATAPRAVLDLAAEHIDGMTCGAIDRTGTVALLQASELAVSQSRSQERQCGITTTANLKLRAESSLDDDVIGFVPRGTTLRLLSRNEHWVRVEYRGEAGWIGAGFVRDDCGKAVDLVSAAAGIEDGSVCTTAKLRVRSGPSAVADTIGFLRSGIMLRPLSQSGDWIEIEYRGEAGWIGASYVSESGDCGGTAVLSATVGEEVGLICTKGDVRVRARPSLDADTVGFLRSGVRLQSRSRLGSWIEIDYRGETGWIGASFVSERGDCGGTAELSATVGEEVDRICTKGDVRVRARPSLEAETIGFLRSGVRLQARSRREDWVEIDYRDEAGWISAEYVSESAGCG